MAKSSVMWLSWLMAGTNLSASASVFLITHMYMVFHQGNATLYCNFTHESVPVPVLMPLHYNMFKLRFHKMKPFNIKIIKAYVS